MNTDNLCPTDSSLRSAFCITVRPGNCRLINKFPYCLQRLITSTLLTRKISNQYCRWVTFVFECTVHINPIHVSFTESLIAGSKSSRLSMRREGVTLPDNQEFVEECLVPRVFELQLSSTPRQPFTHSTAPHVSPGGWLP